MSAVVRARGELHHHGERPRETRKQIISSHRSGLLPSSPLAALQSLDNLRVICSSSREIFFVWFDVKSRNLYFSIDLARVREIERTLRRSLNPIHLILPITTSYESDVSLHAMSTTTSYFTHAHSATSFRGSIRILSSPTSEEFISIEIALVSFFAIFNLR